MTTGASRKEDRTSGETRTISAILASAEPRASAPGLPRQMGPAPVPSHVSPVRRSLSLRHYLGLIQRYRWPVVAFVLLATVSAYLVSRRMTPMYDATLTINLDRSTAAPVVGPDNSRLSSLEMDQFIATQMRLLQSDAVLRPVARRYRLLAGEVAANPRIENAPVLLKDLKITRPPNTYLLQVSFRHADPQVAADATNAIAQSYLEQTYRTGMASFESLATFTQAQVQDLKAKMESSGEALARFEREFNVINPEEKTNILSARLLQINEELTRAQSDRARREAAFRMARDGGTTAAEASPQGDNLKRLGDQEAAAEQKFAEVKAMYGANHPEYRRAQAQLAEIRRQVAASRQNVVGRVESEYQEAAMRESMLRQALADTKAEVDRINGRSFEYQILKQQAEAARRIYNDLIRKTDEARINAGLQGNGIRVADPARAGSKPVTPVIWMNCLLALLGSSLLAICGLVVFDAVDSKVRSVEDVREAAGVDVIGTLPTVKAWRQGSTLGLDAARPVLTPVQSRAEAVVVNYDEEVRMLRGAVMDGCLGRRIGTLLVVSPGTGEGRSTVAANLAVAQSELGRRTLLIDGDFRQPILHRLVFAMTPALGLFNALTGDFDWRQVVIRRSGRPTLHLLPAGPSTERLSEVVNSGFGGLLAEAQQEYDVIIIDSPAFLKYAEAQDMAKFADAVLVVARGGRTQTKDLTAVMQRLRRVRAQVCGVVLNDCE